MKYLYQICLFFLLLLISSGAVEGSKNFSLERKQNSEIPFTEIKKYISCYPTLISHWSNEQGFANKLEIKYGNLGLIRTDVGEPDGNLIVSLKGKEICKIELSLMPNIYYNSKDKILLIYGYSGSNSFIELFSLNNECKYIGWAKLITKSDIEEIETNWYQQPDGSKICRK